MAGYVFVCGLTVAVVLFSILYSREDVKSLTNKVLTIAREAKAEGVEVTFDGGERSGTR